MVHLLLLLLLPALVVVAAVGDLLTMRIPNWLNIAIAMSAFPVAALAGMPLEVFQWHLLTGAGLLFVGFGLFAGGVIGGGDAKLLAAVGLWMGWPQAVAFLVVTALAGGVLAIVVKLWQTVRFAHEVSDVPWFRKIFRADLDLPYGVAIASGCVAIYPQTWWMQAAS